MPKRNRTWCRYNPIINGLLSRDVSSLRINIRWNQYWTWGRCHWNRGIWKSKGN